MDEIIMINSVVLLLILIAIRYGAGFVAIGMAMFYGSYISIDLFWLMFDTSSLADSQFSRFNSVMYLLVSICCTICMLYFFMVALFNERNARISFVVALFIAVYYLVPNLIQANVINYSTGLIQSYEYIYQYSVIVDLCFVVISWLDRRGGNECSDPVF